MHKVKTSIQVDTNDLKSFDDIGQVHRIESVSLNEWDDHLNGVVNIIVHIRLYAESVPFWPGKKL